MPYEITKMADSFLNSGWVNKDLTLNVPSEIDIKAGKVPKPKKNMIKAPLRVSALAKDQVKVE